MAVGRMASALIGNGNSAHKDAVRERQQSRSQQGGDSTAGSVGGCVCGDILRQQFRRQQPCCGGAAAAKATGAKTLARSRTNNALAVRRCIDGFSESRLGNAACKSTT
jgi:hypothetical protein